MPFPLLLVVCIIGTVVAIIVIENIVTSIKNIITRRQITTSNPPLSSVEIV